MNMTTCPVPVYFLSFISMYKTVYNTQGMGVELIKTGLAYNLYRVVHTGLISFISVFTIILVPEMQSGVTSVTMCSGFVKSNFQREAAGLFKQATWAPLLSLDLPAPPVA